MKSGEIQQLINELQGVIDDTQKTINRFEEAGMDEQMPEDYDKLLEILGDAVTQQIEHTLAMLGISVMPRRVGRQVVSEK